jgi:hypothetical protein
MSEARNARYVNEYVETSMRPLSFDQQWARRWQEKAALHDRQVGRNMRLVAVIAMTIGIVWLFLFLR